MFNLTPRMLEILAMMRDGEAQEDDYAAEIVCDGGQCYLGSMRISKSTVNELLSLVALRETNEGGQLRRYTINETGHAIIERPAIKDEIVAALLKGGSFTIRDNAVVPFLRSDFDG